MNVNVAVSVSLSVSEIKLTRSLHRADLPSLFDPTPVAFPQQRIALAQLNAVRARVSFELGTTHGEIVIALLYVVLPRVERKRSQRHHLARLVAAVLAFGLGLWLWVGLALGPAVGAGLAYGQG